MRAQSSERLQELVSEINKEVAKFAFENSQSSELFLSNYNIVLMQVIKEIIDLGVKAQEFSQNEAKT